MFRKKIVTMAVVLIFVLCLGFADRPSSWAENAYDFGLSSGVLHEDIDWNYGENITRQDFAKLAVHMYLRESGYNNVQELLHDGLNEKYKVYTKPFKDLNYSTVNSKYVVAANILGFVDGISTTEFSPYTNLTREQASKILYKAYVKLLSNSSVDVNADADVVKFRDDADIAGWAEKYVYAVREIGIMKGVGANLFDPKGPYTREQAAVTIVRLSRIAREMTGADSFEKSPHDNEGSMPTAYDLRKFEEEVLRLTNEERAKVGLNPLSNSPQYYSYAKVRVREIVDKFSHTRPDGSDFDSGMTGFLAAGENLAGGLPTPEQVVRAWMESKGHRENILRPDFTHLSVAVYYKPDDTMYKWYWVQTFTTLGN